MPEIREIEKGKDSSSTAVVIKRQPMLTPEQAKAVSYAITRPLEIICKPIPSPAANLLLFIANAATELTTGYVSQPDTPLHKHCTSFVAGRAIDYGIHWIPVVGSIAGGYLNFAAATSSYTKEWSKGAEQCLQVRDEAFEEMKKILGEEAFFLYIDESCVADYKSFLDMHTFAGESYDKLKDYATDRIYEAFDTIKAGIQFANEHNIPLSPFMLMIPGIGGPASAITAPFVSAIAASSSVEATEETHVNNPTIPSGLSATVGLAIPPEKKEDEEKEKSTLPLILPITAGTNPTPETETQTPSSIDTGEMPKHGLESISSMFVLPPDDDKPITGDSSCPFPPSDGPDDDMPSDGSLFTPGAGASIDAADDPSQPTSPDFDGSSPSDDHSTHQLIPTQLEHVTAAFTNLARPYITAALKREFGNSPVRQIGKFCVELILDEKDGALLRVVATDKTDATHLESATNILAGMITNSLARGLAKGIDGPILAAGATAVVRGIINRTGIEAKIHQFAHQALHAGKMPAADKAPKPITSKGILIGAGQAMVSIKLNDLLGELFGNPVAVSSFKIAASALLNTKMALRQLNKIGMRGVLDWTPFATGPVAALGLFVELSINLHAANKQKQIRREFDQVSKRFNKFLSLTSRYDHLVNRIKTTEHLSLHEQYLTQLGLYFIAEQTLHACENDTVKLEKWRHKLEKHLGISVDTFLDVYREAADGFSTLKSELLAISDIKQFTELYERAEAVLGPEPKGVFERVVSRHTQPGRVAFHEHKNNLMDGEYDGLEGLKSDIVTREAKSQDLREKIAALQAEIIDLEKKQGNFLKIKSTGIGAKEKAIAGYNKEIEKNNAIIAALTDFITEGNKLKEIHQLEQKSSELLAEGKLIDAYRSISKTLALRGEVDSSDTVFEQMAVFYGKLLPLTTTAIDITMQLVTYGLQKKGYSDYRGVAIAITIAKQWSDVIADKFQTHCFPAFKTASTEVAAALAEKPSETSTQLITNDHLRIARTCTDIVAQLWRPAPRSYSGLGLQVVNTGLNILETKAWYDKTKKWYADKDRQTPIVFSIPSVLNRISYTAQAATVIFKDLDTYTQKTWFSTITSSTEKIAYYTNPFSAIASADFWDMPWGLPKLGVGTYKLVNLTGFEPLQNFCKAVLPGKAQTVFEIGAFFTATLASIGILILNAESKALKNCLTKAENHAKNKRWHDAIREVRNALRHASEFGVKTEAKYKILLFDYMSRQSITLIDSKLKTTLKSIKKEAHETIRALEQSSLHAENNYYEHRALLYPLYKTWLTAGLQLCEIKLKNGHNANDLPKLKEYRKKLAKEPWAIGSNAIQCELYQFLARCELLAEQPDKAVDAATKAVNDAEKAVEEAEAATRTTGITTAEKTQATLQYASAALLHGQCLMAQCDPLTGQALKDKLMDIRNKARKAINALESPLAQDDTEYTKQRGYLYPLYQQLIQARFQYYQQSPSTGLIEQIRNTCVALIKKPWVKADKLIQAEFHQFLVRCELLADNPEQNFSDISNAVSLAISSIRSALANKKTDNTTKQAQLHPLYQNLIYHLRQWHSIAGETDKPHISSQLDITLSSWLYLIDLKINGTTTSINRDVAHYEIYTLMTRRHIEKKELFEAQLMINLAKKYAKTTLAYIQSLQLNCEIAFTIYLEDTQKKSSGALKKAIKLSRIGISKLNKQTLSNPEDHNKALSALYDYKVRAQIQYCQDFSESDDIEKIIDELKRDLQEINSIIETSTNDKEKEHWESLKISQQVLYFQHYSRKLLDLSDADFFSSSEKTLKNLIQEIAEITDNTIRLSTTLHLLSMIEQRIQPITYTEASNVDIITLLSIASDCGEATKAAIDTDTVDQTAWTLLCSKLGEIQIQCAELGEGEYWLKAFKNFKSLLGNPDIPDGALRHQLDLLHYKARLYEAQRADSTADSTRSSAYADSSASGITLFTPAPRSKGKCRAVATLTSAIPAAQPGLAATA